MPEEPFIMTLEVSHRSNHQSYTRVDARFLWGSRLPLCKWRPLRGRRKTVLRQSGGSNRVLLGGNIADVSAARLKSLAACFGKSQQAVVEMLIDVADQRIMERLRKNPDDRLLKA